MEAVVTRKPSMNLFYSNRHPQSRLQTEEAQQIREMQHQQGYHKALQAVRHLKSLKEKEARRQHQPINELEQRNQI
eukprot:gene19210-22631_t